MKIYFKKTVVAVLVATNLVLATNVTTFAKNANDSNIYKSELDISNTSINSNQTLKIFEELGYSDNEIIELYQNDANSFQKTIKLPERLSRRTGINFVEPKGIIALRSFPSHPRVGQTYVHKYDVNFDDAFRRAGLIGYGVTGAASVVANYSPSVVIKAIAAAIGSGAFAVTLAHQIYYNHKIEQGYTGVRGGAKYKWTLSDDLIYDWIYIAGSSWRQYY